ncbi:SpoIIE family protein phosphatase [Cellulomonas sp. ACRRI]|uniref:PP2C family protein-serine/threonine phosphatase n=1 Tax=Cellulomonas sp. ACRRI TaxID=2918188 RepID=UPI001EF38F13|nr:SpoIIE family protein phosphatase [Cellulomonas sp. ACRRI]MCG7286341.1 SpoIIE family protein phosphatase [Cellulomonas sp. ACRRI]
MTPPAVHPTRDTVDYHAVFAALPAPKLVLASDGTVLDMNDAFRTAFAVPPEALVGHALADVLPASAARRELLASVRAAARTGRPQTVGPLPSDGAGRAPWWLLTTTPAADPDGRVTALVLRAADVTAVMTGTGTGARDGAGPPAVVDALVQAVGVERAETDALHGAVLTDLPAVAGLELDVRYRPAHARSRVGGDWYDAFVRPSGDLVVVVGDVTGHDVAAAAGMRQLRGTLRTLGYAEGTGPAATLSRAERTLAGLGAPVTATALVAALGPPGAGDRLRWASAGHLPPVLVRADGRAAPLPGAPELLLGVDPGTARTDRTASLGPGETLLLFTDGLVERRGESVARGLERLVARLPGLRRADGVLDLDALLDRCCPGDREDDVTVLAARRAPAPA